jgi:acetoin utilization deacetylase AcuC-like enzyme
VIAATTGLATDPRFRAHAPPGAHPERPERLVAIERVLEASGLAARATRVPVRLGRRDELLRVHHASYLDSLERALAAPDGGWLDPDTYFSPGSWEAALLAAGASVDLAEAVLDGRLANGLALVRPPGHHASADHAMGFCLINNIAVAAAALSARGARVAVCDFDVHHGNGTQDIFYGDGRVLFASTHQFPYYPGTGALEERGAGGGLGATLNVPLPAGAGDDALLAAWGQVMRPALERFRPDIVLCSAGFDAHRGDPLAEMQVSEAGFAAVTRGLLEASDGRLVLLLEGGYDLRSLSASVAAVMKVLLGDEVAPPPAGVMGDLERQAIDRAGRALAALPVPAP